MEPVTPQAVLIVGANSEIAKAIAKLYIKQSPHQLILISRNLQYYQSDLYYDAKLIEVEQYRESDIQAVVATLGNYAIKRIFICHGFLHNDQYTPEKRLEDFSSESFAQVSLVNTITPMLWLKHLTVILSGNIDCKIVFFSARVGSIGDNKRGGWYSYRSAKAALNMLLKSAAIELKRRAKNIKIIAFHPGTTDSPLSKPFQKNVPKGKLFTSMFVAQQLLTIIDDLAIDGELSYLDWQGETIIW
ncbi:MULTISPECIES: SDR family NAD(P)-dependent oxidoreductase [Thalassotalea]|uniref:SDR family NAD(P)-dependent oxidoreductase n=1 Tax=Thalassotalea TaxID=1518149 RepID=UPI000943FF6A|nr:MULTISPECIES: SDR family NAD(P)-dependent oxidoreductase [Thalassotalea]OKY27860.1 short-chain dehydrogenase [Thalassotalea sp. PP2-459]